MKMDFTRALEISLIAAFGMFTIYSNAKRVPEIAGQVQNHEVRISVTEAHYVDILKSLERIERHIK